MARTLNLKALSDALQRDKGQLSRWSHRPGFPKDTVGGRDLFDADEVRTWIEANIRTKPKEDVPELPLVTAAVEAEKQAPALPAPIVATIPLAKETDPFVQALMSGSASPLDLSKASVQLAARQIGNQAMAGNISTQQLDALKKALEELRRGEEAYIELSTRKGTLVSREVGKAVAGKMALRLNAALDLYINALAGKVEEWLVDRAFITATTEERNRIVRAWAELQATEVRGLEARTIDGLIETMRTEMAEGES